ncbi:hypothetical protein [Actinosynnema sp. ALI-1.44]|uniref:hypothetical protein n=1 Tax=Actinosynnema sp. ALI-1.44 TaxID=1933779 RepID=UPI001178B330|nr:hypothetical protein [Actinosynnema sp. ALI-1.44]
MVLNMFVAVVVNGMDRGMTDELVEAEETLVSGCRGADPGFHSRHKSIFAGITPRTGERD